MERLERLRVFFDSWENYHPNLKEITWDLYIELKKELEAYDAERTTDKFATTTQTKGTSR